MKNSRELFTPCADVHIVVDNSNLFIGSQNGQSTNGAQDVTVRINVRKLVNIIERNINKNNIKTRIVAGSIPPRTARVWKEWENCNYVCLLGERSINNKEVFQDDMLHAQMLKLILESKKHSKNTKQCLILITGDGNNNGNRTNFPDIVKCALDDGWDVTLWSWKMALSASFSNIQQKYPLKMTINYLDEHRSSITFKEKPRNKQLQPSSGKRIKRLFATVVVFLAIFLGLFIYFKP